MDNISQSSSLGVRHVRVRCRCLREHYLTRTRCRVYRIQYITVIKATKTCKAFKKLVNSDF